MQQNDKIGALFSTLLNNYEEEVSFEEMDKMYATISKNKFLSFSFYHFNIYYATAIISGLLLSVSLGCYYIYTTPKNTDTDTATVVLSGSGSGSNLAEHTFKSPLQPAMEKQNKNSEPAMEKPINDIGTATEKQQKPTSTIKLTITEKAESKKDLKGAKPEKEIPELPVSTTREVYHDLLTIKTIDSIKNASTSKALKKKVFIVKKDTIYQTDTLKAKNRKRIKG